MSTPSLLRRDVLGLPVSVTSYVQLASLLQGRLEAETTTVAFCNVHTVMSARRQERLSAVLSEFDVTAPDGMPLVWALRHLYNVSADRVHGPTCMRYLIDHGQAVGWRHFLLGSTPETLRALKSAIGRMFPEAEVAGSFAPPFEPLTKGDLDEITDAIRQAKANFVWVGLGMPKQELLIDEIRHRLRGAALLGVGAAFDLLAGNQPEAPDWMKKRGLEWVYRLAHEPGRLWRRYVIDNPLFMFLLARELLSRRIEALRSRAS